MSSNAVSPPEASTYTSHVCNISDVDPISLEPVADIETYFEYVHCPTQFEDKTHSADTYDAEDPEEVGLNNYETRYKFRYDAWAWLEMLVHEPTDFYVHPVFRTPLNIEVRQACFNACTEALLRTPHTQHTDKQKQLIRACRSQSVKNHKLYLSNNKLGKIHLFPVSPLYDIRIVQWWWKWSGTPKPDFAKPINCQAAIEYALLDCTHSEVLRRRTFV